MNCINKKFAKCLIKYHKLKYLLEASLYIYKEKKYSRGELCFLGEEGTAVAIDESPNYSFFNFSVEMSIWSRKT